MFYGFPHLICYIFDVVYSYLETKKVLGPEKSPRAIFDALANLTLKLGVFPGRGGEANRTFCICVPSQSKCIFITDYHMCI